MNSYPSKITRVAFGNFAFVTVFWITVFQSSNVTNAPFHYTNVDSTPFCSSDEASLHHIALDMFHNSSPPGSLSYKKFKHVLGINHVFYIDLGPKIFIQNQESIAKMLEGYGLQRITSKPARLSEVTLVETMWSESTCPIGESQCRNHSRIHIQSEQYFRDHIMDCHKSPNCVILEFSDYNYCIA